MHRWGILCRKDKENELLFGTLSSEIYTTKWTPHSSGSTHSESLFLIRTPVTHSVPQSVFPVGVQNRGRLYLVAPPSLRTSGPLLQPGMENQRLWRTAQHGPRPGIHPHCTPQNPDPRTPGHRHTSQAGAVARFLLRKQKK